MMRGGFSSRNYNHLFITNIIAKHWTALWPKHIFKHIMEEYALKVQQTSPVTPLIVTHTSICVTPMAPKRPLRSILAEAGTQCASGATAADGVDKNLDKLCTTSMKMNSDHPVRVKLSTLYDAWPPHPHPPLHSVCVYYKFSQMAYSILIWRFNFSPL